MSTSVEITPQQILETYKNDVSHSQPILATFSHFADPDTYYVIDRSRLLTPKKRSQLSIYRAELAANLTGDTSKDFSFTLSGYQSGLGLHLSVSSGTGCTLSSEWVGFPSYIEDGKKYKVGFETRASFLRDFDPTSIEGQKLLEVTGYFTDKVRDYFQEIGRPESVMVTEAEARRRFGSDIHLFN